MNKKDKVKFIINDDPLLAKKLEDKGFDELEERAPAAGQNQPTVNVAQENVRSETNQRNFLNDQSQGKLAKEASDKD